MCAARTDAEGARTLLLARGWSAAQVVEALEREAHTTGGWIEDLRQKGPAGLALEQTGGVLCWPHILIRRDSGSAGHWFAAHRTDTKRTIRETFVQSESLPWLDRHMKAEHSRPVDTGSCRHTETGTPMIVTQDLKGTQVANPSGSSVDLSCSQSGHKGPIANPYWALVELDVK